MRLNLGKLMLVAGSALSVAAMLSPAQANWRCGYDRYGYHPPSFRGCDRYWREQRDEYRGFRRYDYASDYPANGYYELPLYGGRVGHRCYYDHAWTNVVRVCY